MTDIQSIPLNKLVPWDGNVRKTGVMDGIDELAASIAAHGLLQPLLVRPGTGKKGRGKFAVVAGQRRLIALNRLMAHRTIDKDAAIPCMVIESDADAAELSLAENVVRSAMHPADQFEAFRDLADKGSDVETIAARFGVTETTVRKRLKLGRLSPVILDAYRKADIGLEEAQAFAISDDCEAQERIFGQLFEYNRTPRNIRNLLTEGEIDADDRRVTFVGLEAYEQAGGIVRRDLFDDEASGTITDPALLDRLVAEKLRALASQVMAEGWKWVETVSDYDRSVLAEYRRIQPDRVELPEDVQSEWETLASAYDELADSDDEGVEERLAQLQRRIDEIEAMQWRFPQDAMATAGAVVYVGYDGEPGTERGLIRRGDAPASSAEPGKSKPASGLPVTLIEDLTAQKSAAISAELMERPDIALAVSVHAMALSGFYGSRSSGNCVDLNPRQTRLDASIKSTGTCIPLTAIDERRSAWQQRLPDSAASLWAWCLERSREELLELLAFLTALSVDAVQRKADHPHCTRLLHADELARALSLDMGKWFTPTGANYFSRIRGSDILAAITEAKGSTAPAWNKLKKSELVALAERQIAGTGWLPEAMRIPAEAPVAEIEADDLSDDSFDDQSEDAFEEAAE